MSWRDEEGQLFGRINPIDAVGVLIAIIVVVSAAAVFLPGYLNQPQEDAITIQVQTDQIPTYVANSTNTGPVPSNDNVLAVANKSVSRTMSTPNGSVATMNLQLRVRATSQEGELYLSDDRIYVGNQVTLDLGRVVLDGTVTNISNVNMTTR